VLNGWHDQFWTRMHRNDFLRLLRSSGVRPNNSTRDRIRALLRGFDGLGHANTVVAPVLPGHVCHGWDTAQGS
jgi:hypothetical protein